MRVDSALEIVFIATAAQESGAWRIVTEFGKLTQADNSAHYTFITTKPLGQPGINNIVVAKRGLLRRLFFECFSIRRLLLRAGKPPDVVVSLNNLGILGAVGIQQFVYVHQALPFYPELTWGWGERKQLFYQRIYGLLMWISIRFTSSKVIVQTRTMQDRVRRRWGMDSLCWFPKFAIEPHEGPMSRKMEGVWFFYPATFHSHKNHIVLARALADIKARRPDLYEVIRVGFTVDESARGPAYVDPHLDFIGECTFGQVDGYYAVSAALLFPSLVETVGLPLVEASRLGLPILCTDADYSREILVGYEGVTFVKPNTAGAWADTIIEIVERVSAVSQLERFTPHVVSIQETNLADIKP